MALNYSHQPLFPAHISGNNLWSPMRTVNGCLAEGASEKYGDEYLMPWHSSQGEMEDWHFSCRKDSVDRCCSPESNSKDIADLLPSDPFGMDIKSTITAITGWLEDLDFDYGGYVRSNNGWASEEDYGLFAGWNLIWNNALKSRTYPINVQSSENLDTGTQLFSSIFEGYEKPDTGEHSVLCNGQFDEKLNGISKVNEYGDAREMEGSLASYDIGFQPACSKGVGSINESTSCSHEVQFGKSVEGATESEEALPEAFKFCLMYLGLKDLLSVERVCSSLHSEVRGDPLLWKSIHIDQPLNEKITDDLLFQLACRADGDLRCLSLVECPKITDDGIRRILESNSRLTKLFVPGCTRLTIEGILNNIRAHNSNKDAPGIKHLRIGGLYGVTHEHFEELKFLLGTDDHKLGSNHHKPHFYHRGNIYLPYEDDRAIDIEMCPRCEKFRLVYDCPAESCQVSNKASSHVCKACTLCVPRCAQCGRCINDNEYEETFCLDLLCSDCYKLLINYQDEKANPYGAQHDASNHA